MSEPKVIDNSSILQLDVFHELMNLYYPRRTDRTPKRLRKRHADLSHSEAFRMLPIGNLVVKPFRGMELRVQAYHYSGRHWRVHYENSCRDENKGNNETVREQTAAGED